MSQAAVAAIALLILAVLGVAGYFRLARAPAAPDISGALRDLLLQRAQGKIDTQEFEARQAALHASLLTPARRSEPGVRRLLYVATGSIAAFGVVLYLWIGAADTLRQSGPAAIAPASVGPSAAPVATATPQSKAGGDLNVMVKRLADKMAADPRNGDGWLLLARTYGELRQPREAADAYAKAAALLPPNAALLADWAAVLVASRDNQWDDQSREVLKRALAVDPAHLKTIALAGTEAFERADHAKAIEYWERLKKLAPPDSPDAKLAEANLAEVRARPSGKVPGVKKGAGNPSTTAKDAP